MPNRIESSEPVFIDDEAMRVLSVDTYFLTLHYPSVDQPDNGTWYDETKITLKVARKSQAAYPRIAKWVEQNFPGHLLHDWEYDDPSRPYRGVVGLMTMRSVA